MQFVARRAVMMLAADALIDSVLSAVGGDRLHLTQWSQHAKPKDYINSDTWFPGFRRRRVHGMTS
jgi:hypothetical protein